MSAALQWIAIPFVGALIGIVLGPALKGFFRWIFLRPKPKHLIGEWYEYHWSYANDQPVLYSATCRIRRGFRHPFAVSLVLSDGLVYRGHAIPEQHHFIMAVGQTAESETGFYRFPIRLPSDSTPLVGFWLSYDHDKIVTTGAALLSKTQLSDNEAKAVIQDTVRHEHAIPLMRETRRAAE